MCEGGLDIHLRRTIGGSRQVPLTRSYRCLAAMINPLADNTNADIPTRAVWIELAAKLKIPIRCVYFTTPTKLCEHNDTVRALAMGSFNPEKRSMLPHSAFAGFSARFKEPSIKEGFQDITRIDFEVGISLACLLHG